MADIEHQFNEDPYSYSADVLNGEDERKIMHIIEDAIWREMRQQKIRFIVSDDDGEPKMLLCNDDERIDYMLVTNDLDWFVNEFMEAINERDYGGPEAAKFLESIAKAFGYVSEAATKKLQETQK